MNGFSLPSSYTGFGEEIQIIRHPFQVPSIQESINASKVKLLRQVVTDEKYKRIKQKLEGLKQRTLIPVGLTLQEIESEVARLDQLNSQNLP